MIHDDAGLVLEPDRRYWRRRANRTVRQARRTRRLLRGLAAGTVNLGIFLALALAGLSALRHFVSTPRFEVRAIEVSGTSHTSPDRVREALSRWQGRNLLDLDLDVVAQSAQGDPWVESASVSRLLPHTLAVTVRERTPGALALLDGRVQLVDLGGTSMGPARPGFAFDLPVLVGLDRWEGPRRAEILKRGVSFVTYLRARSPAWTHGISEVDLSLPDRVAIVRSEPGPRILLDPDRIDRNLDEWLRLQAELSRRLGPAEYVDLRWNRRITVKPQTPSLSKSE